MDENINLINYYPQISSEALRNNITNGYVKLSWFYIPLGNLLLRVDPFYNKIFLWLENENKYVLFAKIIHPNFSVNM